MNRSDVAGKLWDCIIIGAGPAGAVAAKQIASQKKSVLLVDKAIFPRHKICGCCLNGSAQAALAKAGLGDILRENNAVPLQTLQLFDKGKIAKLALPVGLSLSREKLDFAVITAARQHGAQFLPNSTAKVLDIDDLPLVQIESSQWSETIKAKLVIIADGLAGRSLDSLTRFTPIIHAKSRFGAGLVLAESPSWIEYGQIYMACNNGGYVGMVKLEDGRLNIAAAFDRQMSRRFNGIGLAAAHLLNQNQLPIPSGMLEANWRGTDSLSRIRPQIASRRLFVIGDACGYTEPFTGEGMAWALWSGLAVVDLAIRGINLWNDDLIIEWQKTQNKIVAKQPRSEAIAFALRNSMLRTLLVNILSISPNFAAGFIRDITNAQKV